MNRHRSFIKS